MEHHPLLRPFPFVTTLFLKMVILFLPKFRRTALHRVSLEGHKEIAEKLLARGATVDFRDRVRCLLLAQYHSSPSPFSINVIYFYSALLQTHLLSMRGETCTWCFGCTAAFGYFCLFFNCWIFVSFWYMPSNYLLHMATL